MPAWCHILKNRACVRIYVYVCLIPLLAMRPKDPEAQSVSCVLDHACNMFFPAADKLMAIGGI